MDALIKTLATCVKGTLENEFTVILTPAGAVSPRGTGKYTPKHAEVEFYDARYQEDPRFTPLGQFVSSYRVGTLIDHRGGLDLMGYEPSWKVTAEGMDRVIAALREAL